MKKPKWSPIILSMRSVGVERETEKTYADRIEYEARKKGHLYGNWTGRTPPPIQPWKKS